MGYLLGIFWLGSLPLFAPAASLILTPIADTTLSERYPENNFGAMPTFNSGTTQNSNYNRGLLQFDVAAALPAGAKITAATLTLEIVGEPAEEFPVARFNLHRMLVPWAEGTKTNPPFGGLGVGSPATTNEATWTHRFAFTTHTWTQAGAAAPLDYVAASSAGASMGGVDQSPYTILNTVQLVADLQLWLDQPATNYGWALVCQQETTKFTARRFASREDPENAPELHLTYLIPPQIDQIQKTGNHLNLYFLAHAHQNYAVEFRTSLTTNDWQLLATIPPFAQHTQVLVVDTVAAPQRYYRLNSW